MEDQTRLHLCFALPPNVIEVGLPELTFYFKGGIEMWLLLENYFVFARSNKVMLCLTIVSSSDGVAPSDVVGGLTTMKEMDWRASVNKEAIPPLTLAVL